MTDEDPFWGGLNEAHRAVLGGLLSREVFPSGAVVFSQGDIAERAYFLTRGSLEVSVRLPGGAVSYLTTLGPGSMLGELGLTSIGQRRTATVVATEESEAFSIHRRDLHGLWAQHNPAAAELTLRMSTYLRDSLGRITAERLTLGAMPLVAPPPEEAGSDGGPVDAARVLAHLPFGARMVPEERDAIFGLGRLRTHRGATSIPVAPSSTYLVVRGSLEICGRSERGWSRLRVIGPGQCVHVDTIDTKLVVRSGATLLELDAAARGTLHDPKSGTCHSFLEALMTDLMQHIERDTRALSRERRQVGAA